MEFAHTFLVGVLVPEINKGNGLTANYKSKKLKNQSN